MRLDQNPDDAPLTCRSTATSLDAPALTLLEELIRCPEAEDPRRVFIEGLRCLEGVSGAWLGRPDAAGRMVVETVSDPVVQSLLDAVPIRIDDSAEGREPIGRAWRSSRVECVDDWRREVIGGRWSEAVTKAGFTSSASVVLRGRRRAREILTVYSDRSAWFSSGVWPALMAHIASIFGLVLEERDLRRRLVKLARLDPLTELPNRRALEEHLDYALAQACGHRRPFAAGIIDLDDFKLVNDRFGHDAGDRLLQCVARRMRSNLRQEDFLARQGGDEFMVVFDDFDAPDNLEPLLEHLHQAIVAPIEVPGGETVRIEASMGFAIWPSHSEDKNLNAGALLRRAGYALYRAKQEKPTRAQWWSVYSVGAPMPPPVQPQQPCAQPFGEAAAHVLRPIQDLLGPVNERFINASRSQFTEDACLVPLLNALTPKEFKQLKTQQGVHLTALTDPDLEESAHDSEARRLGWCSAACGFDETWVSCVHEAYLDSLLTTLLDYPVRLHQALPVISARLAHDWRAQLNGYHEAAAARNTVVDRLTACLGETGDSLHFTEVLVELLLSLDEISAACVTRRDGTARPRVTALSCRAEVDASLLESALDGKALSTLVAAVLREPAKIEGSACAVEHCLNFATAETLPKPLRGDFLRLGLCSVAVVAWTDGRVPCYLWLFSRWPGGFSSIDQRSFLQQVGQLVALGWEQLPDPGLFTVAERRRTRGALQNGALVMHYQPVTDLKTGEVVKVEGLARLRVGDCLLLPDQFLPLFDHDELFSLYRLALRQGLEDIQRWAAEGQPISLGLNISPLGLFDERYLEVMAQALAAAPLSEKQRLYLEILETDTLDLSDHNDPFALFQPWLDLGVHFAEDDLGAGYSSLLRMHRLPFELVKIDQRLVQLHTRQPDRATICKILAFIAALTHLAHVLGLRVCVEGLESRALIEAAATFGADFGQGFAIARPMPAEAVVDWAARGAKTAAPNLNMASDDFIAAYEELHETLSQSGINSDAHARAYWRLYGLHAERIERRAKQLHT